ncbi:hyalin-like [Anneissia japonica]|uniref:hyalin-like n=1 Tax=Anneissia japonica TaxID=1529436 RepID=UPI00142550FE|nr:hyalin-like [Anneissia japonica]
MISTNSESPVVNRPSHSSNFASRESNSAWSVSTDEGSRFARLYWLLANATDNSGTAASVNSNYNPGDIFRVSNAAYQITYTAIDEAGNTGYCSFFIKVQDSESPVVNRPSHSSNFASRESNSAWSVSTDEGSRFARLYWLLANATDNSGTVASVNSNYNPGDIFRVNLESPLVECPTHIETRSALVTWDITISDNVAVVHCLSNDSRVTPTNSLLNDRSITLAQSGTFPVGTKFIEYMATDLAWNVGKCLIKITVAELNYHDYIYGFHRLVTDYGQPFATVIWSPPEVEDNIEGPVTWESYPYTSGDTFPLRLFPPYTVKFSASDLFGNSRSCYVYFTIIDVEAPTITCPTNITNYYDTYFGINRAALDPGSSTSTVTWDYPTVFDNSRRPVIVTSTHLSGETFPPRFYPPYEVEYTAKNESGNKNSCKFHFLVSGKSDTSKPLTYIKRL